MIPGTNKENKPQKMNSKTSSETSSDGAGDVAAPPEVDIKPILVILGCALVGTAIGLWFSFDDSHDYTELNSWVALPGDLFLRGLRCVVLPMIFVNIILAVIDMIQAGKATSIGGKTVILYTFTTILAALEGLTLILLFKSSLSPRDLAEEPTKAQVTLQCENYTEAETFISITEDGDLVCSERSDNFIVNDLNAFFVATDNTEVADDISFSDTLQDGIFRKMVPENIMEEFVNANFVGVLMFAIVFGMGCQAQKEQPVAIIQLLDQVNKVFLSMIHWVIATTPVAVGSLVAGNLGGREDLAEMFVNIIILMVATLIAMIYPSMFYYFVGENPFAYYRYLIPAQTVGFACGSSAATLPVSLECVASTNQVPSSVRNFVLSMGATLNMDGGGIYFPCTIVFMAVSDGFGDQLNFATYLLIIILSTIGSAGTAPVPSASLVLIITAYNTVFDVSGTPDSFGLILAIDWFMDRFRVVINVTGDMTMARIVTAWAEVSVEDDARLAELLGKNKNIV
eukprot:snap_masked-scaffold_2-processed-gene-25.8-mRNA-1 protein AED:0.01 eAED:0.01 QI:0/0/0/1/1/1/2/0/511